MHLEIRQTPYILVIRLILLEIFITILHLSIRLGLDFLGYGDFLPGELSLYGLLIVLLQGSNLVFFFVIILQWLNHYYQIEDDEIRFISGILKKTQVRFQATTLEKIQTSQGISGRLFNYGDVKAYNPVLGIDIVLSNIPKPSYYAGILESIRKERDVNILRSR